MSPIHGTYFDGEILRGISVTLEFSEPDRLHIYGEGLELTVSWQDITVSDRLAHIARFLYLPGRAVIETQANDAIDGTLRAQRRGLFSQLIHALEEHSAIAAGATLLLVLCTTLVFYLGLPVLSRHTAHRTPPAVEVRIGQISLAAFNKYFSRSELTTSQRDRVIAQLHRLLPDRDETNRPRLVFRTLGAQTPNAFALPGGVIIVSDELVQLADSDDEIAAVLAHEIGHLELKHGIQGALRSSFALLTVSALTGDLSSLTTFAGSIPWLILNNGYSREFEREADDYAHALMLKRGVRLKHFATILQKLESASASGGRAPRRSYLATHPAAEDRIRLFQPHPDPTPPPTTSHAPASEKPSSKLPATAEREPIRRTKFPTNIKALPDLSNTGHTDGEPDFAFIPYTNLTPPPAVAELRRVYDLPKHQTPPVVIIQVPTVYPKSMHRLNLQGEALVDFIVDRGGDVRAAYVVRATNTAFAEAALRAVEQWKFTPARLHGEAVNAHVQLPVKFTIGDSPATATP